MAKKPGNAIGRTGDGLSFYPLWPSPTAGDGKMRSNNARPGKDQPNAKPSNKRKVRCQNCGFLADLHKHISDGGDLSGDGGGGTITITDGVGNQAYRRGSGCPFCFSRNFSTSRNYRND